MKKILIAFMMTVGILSAGLVDGIALVVNEEPITLYDIDKKMLESNLSKKDAVSLLIDELLYEQELRKYNIEVDIFDVNNYIEKIAARNKMDLYQFKSIIKQKFKDFSQYEDKIKKDISRQKLVSKVLRGNLKKPTDTDLEIYYDNNLKRFSNAAKFHVVQYVTKNKRALMAIKKTPMAIFNEVQKTNVVYEQSALQPKIKYLLNSTDERDFSPIFTANNNFVMLYISKKENVEVAKLEDVKEKILQILYDENQKRYLQDFFEKLKLSADIKAIR
ncbi:MAG: peptidyl-prolyl cis-trans isomerase [Campylobacteraceae bacterium]|nr:peptidyl-prolyl cis-trans isomerase [Campylobacteraceae bacterium]